MFDFYTFMRFGEGAKCYIFLDKIFILLGTDWSLDPNDDQSDLEFLPDIFMGSCERRLSVQRLFDRPIVITAPEFGAELVTPLLVWREPP
jgi:hypothetical protein